MVDKERQVLLLDTLEPSSIYTSAHSMTSYLSVSTSSSQSRAAAQKSCNKTNKPLSSISSLESEPPDVIFHSDGCAIALHLSVLQRRCPWLYKQLLQLRHSFDASNGFKLLDDEELQQLKHNEKDRSFSTCPLHDPHSLRLDYVYCVAHTCRSGEISDDTTAGQCFQTSPVLPSRKKRLRQEFSVPDKKQMSSGQNVIQKSRRVRSLCNELNPTTLARRQQELEHDRSMMHVEIKDTNIGAVVTAVEYIYRRKVRMIDEHNAMEAVKLGQKLGMRCSMLYYCLVIAIRHVTTATWIDMLLIVSTLENKKERQILCDYLLAFMKSLKPEQHLDALRNMRCVHLKRLKDHDVLVRAVVGLMNIVRLVGFWRNLLDALSQWLSNQFQSVQVPSLRVIHRHFAPEWKPYLEQKPVELFAKAGEKKLFTLLQFGKFQLQVRIDITNEMPILWRIIRSSSPQLLSSDPDDPASLEGEPQFRIQGQMKVKYCRAYPNQAKVSQEVVIQYHHCCKQYSQWCDLVPPTPSTLAPDVTTAAHQSECMGKAKFRGKFFIWGDPVCSMYHFLLQTTLFYSAPDNTPTEISDLVIVSEMQRLPLETLELVLRSDGLRIPDGERTLLRCLNKLFFGKNFSYLGSLHQEPREFNGRRKDIIRLYKCVRWCFIPVDDIIDTLRQSPRELKFYELIEKGLQDTFRRFLRRCPWGWHKYRHAYRKNETSVVEFRIEAGKNQLSPEYFPAVPKAKSRLQDFLLLSPDNVFYDPPRVQSVP
ncbi:unnamed protein product [Peronospora farinosa]|uniref:BTB domain-containing protein n=3 Tax=Peronospora farinosa TaxID=134698 RepID=A0AAV0T6Y9_9STRA|nr:unnamed protein product [Peronospora farinosa]